MMAGKCYQYFSAVHSFCIGAAAGSVMFLVPSAPPVLMYGVAAGLASLGTSTLEYILKKKLGVPTDDEPK